MERRFRVWRLTDNTGIKTEQKMYKIGDVFIMERDDTSTCPYFSRVNGVDLCIYLHNIEEIDEQGNIIRRFDVGSTYTNPIDLPLPEVSTQERIARMEKELTELKKSLEPKKVKFIPGKVYKSNKGRVVVCSSDDGEVTFSGVQLTFPGKESEGRTSDWAKCCFHPVEIQVIDSTE